MTLVKDRVSSVMGFRRSVSNGGSGNNSVESLFCFCLLEWTSVKRRDPHFVNSHVLYSGIQRPLNVPLVKVVSPFQIVFCEFLIF